MWDSLPLCFAALRITHAGSGNNHTRSERGQTKHFCSPGGIHVLNAGDIMTRDVITCRAGDPAAQVVSLLVGNSIGGVPVLDDAGLLVGMLTEGDFLRMCLPSAVRFLDTVMYLENTEPFEELIGRMRHLTAGDIMSRGVLTAEPGQSAGQVAAIMLQHGIKQVPIVEEGKLTGIVARQDILQMLDDYLKRGDPVPGRKNVGKALKNDIY